VILDPARQPLPPTGAAILGLTKLRVAIALAAGVAAVLVHRGGVLRGVPLLLVACIAAYAVLVAALHVVVRRRARAAAPTVIGAALLGDLLLVFAATALTSQPGYYGRSLIFALVVLHLAEFHFGRGYSYLVIGAATSGYLALAGAALPRGASLAWGEELCSAGAFAVAALFFVQRYGSLHHRATRIVSLFDRAREGDFTQEYDVAADRYPDAITAVGQAYNRVREQLQTLVLTDPLTGCLNRRGFEQALAREIARSTRAGSELALLAIDLDHFKQLNDRCGHLAGDAVLRDLGALLRESARAGDVVARTGGEEFTLILPDTHAVGASQLATRLCERIRARAFVVESRSLRITISVGVAAASGGEAVDRQGQELKRRADQALYAAKRLGRDRVLTWSA